ncbi:MAG: aminotransferase class III-fold pyridoxal phosphate-dependent enzyme [Gammaproteobacteria bacterium]|nr:aminotransferase class III-fold pyridoxal phosphate-dependent enzyme [Gammaproteobacteria bacterium]
MPVPDSDRPRLDAALAKARARYVADNPASESAHHQARQFMPGGNTRTILYHDPFPLRAVSGHGARITDADGHEYLNLLGEYTAGLFGHTHPVIRAAIDSALDCGINLSAHNTHEIRLAELVCGRFPSIERVRFTNSGTEANLMAIATARHHTGRGRVMVMHGGYHGGLLYFGDGGIPINAPYDFVLGRFNRIDATRELIRGNAGDLACVLVEPMMGSAGCLPADPDFLCMLREETRNAGTILIFDEVMTSRLSPGGAQQHYDVLPDLTTLGKYIGGGMSFGAFGGTQEIMAMYDPGRPNAMPHAGTFNNNTLSMAAGAAAMGEVFTPLAATALNARGDALRRKLNTMAEECGAPVHLTGIGSLMNLHGCRTEIRDPQDLVASDDRIKQLVFLDLLERGFYIARRGFVALMLPHTDRDLEAFSETMEDILEQHAGTWS